MDAKSFIIVYIKTDDIYKDIAEYVETGFDISNCKLDDHYRKERTRKLSL